MGEITDVEMAEEEQWIKSVTFDAPGTAYLEGLGKLDQCLHGELW